ncbi:MAG: hypothetical protein RR614_04200, partial [Eubacterium sp.]
ENQTFQTKGDANDTVDGGAVAFANLVGKPLFTIPYMGYVAVYANTPTGMIVLVTVILVILILTFLPDFLMKGDKSKEKKIMLWQPFYGACKKALFFCKKSVDVTTM